MPILNYTTKITPEKSAAEITRKLCAHGASRVSIEYGKDRTPVGLDFVLSTQFGPRSFRLPAQVAGVQLALTVQAKRGKISRALASKEHAERVAWRILKDWLEAQLALIEAGLVHAEEVLLPYMIETNERTVYQNLMDRKLQLEGPR